MTLATRNSVMAGSILAAAMFAVPGLLQAQVFKVPVRVAARPVAGDTQWIPSITFEKQVDCARVGDSSTAWPPTGDTPARATVRRPLWNLNLPSPDGDINVPDDGRNVVYLTLPDYGGGSSIVCRGTILADGIDVTLRDGSDVANRPNGEIRADQPLTVAPKLDWKALIGAHMKTRGPLPEPEPIVAFARTEDLRQTHYIDFDAATASEDNIGTRADLWFRAIDWDHMELDPANGATISPGSSTRRRYRGCAQQSFSTAPVRVSNALAGKYYCVRTSGRRMAELYIAGIKGNVAARQPLVLVVSFAKWRD
jgi:hypothetical protein